MNIFKLSKPFQKHILDAKFEEILQYFIEFNSLDFLYFLIKNTNNQKFIQTIKINQLNRLTIKEHSFSSNMSISKYPNKWFQEKRLKHVAFLLKNKSKRSSDIIEEIRYKNLSNFIQAFKIKHGVTPKQYQSN